MSQWDPTNKNKNKKKHEAEKGEEEAFDFGNLLKASSSKKTKQKQRNTGRSSGGGSLEDEAALLASLGSTTAQASLYESSVLEAATQGRNAPPQSRENALKLLPDIQSYVSSCFPSTSVSSSILSSVQSKIQSRLLTLEGEDATREGHEANLLRVMFQMLSSQILSSGKPSKKMDRNAILQTRQEAAAERERSQWLLTSTASQQKRRVRSADGVEPPVSAQRKKSSKTKLFGSSSECELSNRLENIKEGSASDWVVDAPDETNSAEQGQEKEGEEEARDVSSSSKTSSFGLQSLLERQASRSSHLRRLQLRRQFLTLTESSNKDNEATAATKSQKKKRRMLGGVMSAKREMRMQDQHHNWEHIDEAEEYEHRLERIKQKREERRQRRLLRQQRQRPQINANEEGEGNQETSPQEKNQNEENQEKKEEDNRGDKVDEEDENELQFGESTTEKNEGNREEKNENEDSGGKTQLDSPEGDGRRESEQQQKGTVSIKEEENKETKMDIANLDLIGKTVSAAPEGQQQQNVEDGAPLTAPSNADAAVVTGLLGRTDQPEENDKENTRSTVVTCPVCSQSLPVLQGTDPDAFLSQHVGQCQQKHSSLGTVGGRVLRPRRAGNRTKLPCYREIDEGEDEEPHPISKREKPDKQADRNDEEEQRDDGDFEVDSNDKKQEEELDDDFVQEDNKDSVNGNKRKRVTKATSKKRTKSAQTSISKRNSTKTSTTPLQEQESEPPPFKTGPPPIDDMEEYYYEDRVEEWMQSGLAKMRKMSERDETETPPGAAIHPGGLVIPSWMNNRLFPYQRTGLRWMWELHQQNAGGIVGDEMGLGKTVQISSFLGSMALSRKLRSVLVVCPATVLSHWLSELATWAPGLRRILLHKSAENKRNSKIAGVTVRRDVSTKLLRYLDRWLNEARADRLHEAIDETDFDNFEEDMFCGTGYVVVTTYEMIRRGADVWTQHSWSYIVLDEGQKIRNPDADVTLSCKRLRTPHRLLLSGTPIQNDLRELWTLFDFVFPGRLGTLPAFETEFADPIRRGGYANASRMQVQLAYRCSLVLRDLINPYLLRRRKKDVREVSRMPGKTEQVLFCRLSSRQRMLYESYLGSDEVANVIRGSHQSFRAITVLRKICNHPDLVCRSDESSAKAFCKNGAAPPPPPHPNADLELSSSSDESELDDDGESVALRSGKLEVLSKILPLWKRQGHRVLLFCQWTKMLNIIQRFVVMQEWKFLRMDGSTNVASRQRLVDTFNDDDSFFVMLLTTKTGGVGLNLTGADRIILYDPDWNPQTDAQARERAWRFGQKNAVTVYRLITAGTIEEKIYHRQIFKTAVTNQVLQDPKQRSRLFSQRDLKDLFTLRPDPGKDGDNIETGEITKGGGVIDTDRMMGTQNGTSQKNGAGNERSHDGDEGGSGKKDDDNENTLEAVMKTKGLAGVFDHDFVESFETKKSVAAQEMEAQAKLVAQKAAIALRDSSPSDGMNEFVPTWTGSEITKQPPTRQQKLSPSSRFGMKSSATGSLSPRSKRKQVSFANDYDNSFGGAASAGLASSAPLPSLRGGGGGVTSSAELLSQLKKRRDEMEGLSSPFSSLTPADKNRQQKR